MNTNMLYPELFKQFETLRWNMEGDIPWGDFQSAKLSDEQALTIKMNAITEWAARQPGFQYRTLVNRGDQGWTDMVWWASEAEAKAARLQTDAISDRSYVNPLFLKDAAPPTAHRPRRRRRPVTKG